MNNLFETIAESVPLPRIGESNYTLHSILNYSRHNINDALSGDEVDTNRILLIMGQMQTAIEQLCTENHNTQDAINITNQIVGNVLGNIKTKMNNHISYIHNCATCGHPLELPENHPIFNCKYCGSVYVIGPTQIHSEY